MNLGDNFYKKLQSISAELGMAPEHILNVMALETGINPSKQNSNGGATGLVQFMPNTLKGLGFKGTPQDFGKLSGEEQLDYVKKLIKGLIKYNGGPFKSAAQYYVGNFLPAALKLPGIKSEDPKTIIAQKNTTVAHVPNVSIEFERKIYEANHGLDSDKDGAITYGDLQRKLSAVAKGNIYLNAIKNLNNPQVTPEIKNDNNLNDNNLVSIVDGILKQIFSNDQNYYTLQLRCGNKNAEIELATLISEALYEENKITSSLHFNKNIQVEIKASKDFENTIKNTIKLFKNATGIKTTYHLTNARSLYKVAEPEFLYECHKKFLGELNDKQ